MPGVTWRAAKNASPVERQLIDSTSLNLAHRWYMGQALDEELTDHSNLTRIR